MRHYECYFGTLNTKREFLPSGNNACWSYMIKFLNEDIYITKYKEKETEKYVVDLVRIINEITYCKLIEINNVDFIYFKALSTYDQNLILLNFIRNLWYEQFKGYSVSFFEALFKDTIKIKDPLERLTTANKIACKNWGLGQDHSNCCRGESLKPKKTKDLLEYKGTSTQIFLTT